MKKNLKMIFSLLLILSILGTIPALRNRINVEESNNVYQVALSYDSIREIKNEEERQKYYEKLKKDDINTIAFSNLSIKDLSAYRDIKYITIESYLKEREEFNYSIDNLIDKYASKYNFLIMVSKADFLETELELIKNHLKDYKMKEDATDIYFYIDEQIEITYDENKTPNSILVDKVFIDQKAIKEVVDNGMKPMLNIVNQKNTDNQNSLFYQIEYLINEYGIDKVQVGKEMIGYPKNVGDFLELFKENNVKVVTTEFETTLGLNTYSKYGQEDLIRGHEVNLKDLKLSSTEFAERVARGVKERNMRVILVSEFIDYRTQESIETTSNDIIKDINLAKGMLNRYLMGDAKEYKEIQKSKSQEILSCVAFSSIIAILILSIIDKDKFSIILSLVGFFVSLAVSFFVIKSNNISLIKLFALSGAVIGAVGAILIPYKLETRSISIRYVYSSVMTILTGLLVASILYGIEYILKLESFSGVKVLYISPVIIISLYMLIDSKILSGFDIRRLKSNNFSLKTIIKRIKWYHIFLALVVLVGAYVYISRSGNDGNVSNLELKFRTMLENILIVRPRTKEFLIGYPALLIGLYMMRNNIKYAPYMMIIASIGTMSTVNTFTHLHTPLTNSLLRSFYGVLIGALVGIIVISIFKWIFNYFKEEI